MLCSICKDRHDAHLVVKHKNDNVVLVPVCYNFWCANRGELLAVKSIKKIDLTHEGFK